MLRKLVFAFIYMTFVVVISRIVDIAIKSYELTAISLLPVRVVLDPAMLSVSNLKAILENRGISYGGVVEKKELYGLVHASGDITAEEMHIHSMDSGSSEPDISELTSGSHFYEVVEDTKDSAWIVLVVPLISGIMSLNRVSDEWKEVVRKTSKFGIRAAIFDCRLDPDWCDSRQWTSARLLLAVPKHDTSKGDVLLKQYMVRSSFSSGAIFRWIRDELASRVTMIDSISDLSHNWLHSQNSDDQIMRTKVLLISRLETPPLLLSALAIKFNGRATFGMYRAKVNEHRLQLAGQDFSVPACLIALSNDSLYSCATHAGAALHFRSMNLLMKTFNPEPNDLFVISMILVNVVVSIDLFWMRCSKIWKHFIYWFIHALKANCVFLLVWLSILTLCGIPTVRSALNASHFWLHSVACTRFADIVRHDATIYYQRIPVLVVAYAVSCILLASIRRKFFCQPDSFDDDDLFREWSPLESTILNYILFRPIGMSIPTAASLMSQSNSEDELIAPMIERLVFPNLWLQEDLISTEYINSLPLWLYADHTYRTGSESNNEETAADQQSSSVSEVSDSEIVSLSQTYSQPNSIPSAIDEFSPYKSCRKRSSGGRLKATGVHNNSNRDISPINAAPVGTIRSTVCAICLEAYKQNQVLCTLPCGHAYHDSCIFSWLMRDNHMCPTCRWPSNKAKTA